MTMTRKDCSQDAPRRAYRTRSAALLWLLLPLAAAGQEGAQDRAREAGARLDPTGSFFEPPFAQRGGPLFTTTMTGLDLQDYQRYLVARADRGLLADFAFVRLVAEECRRAGLARTAPQIARASALRRAKDFGSSPAGQARMRAFQQAELERLRVDALVRKDRRVEERDLRLLFDTRYGLGGVRVEVQHILVSFVSTERRLQEAGETPTREVVEARSLEDATAIRRAILEARSLAALAHRSDDPTTVMRLQDPRTKARAAIIEGYDYQRFGPDFAACVRALEPGRISDVLRTSHGYHVLEVTKRTVTDYRDVEASLRADLATAPASPREVQELEQRLFARHGIDLR